MVKPNGMASISTMKNTVGPARTYLRFRFTNAESFEVGLTSSVVVVIGHSFLVPGGGRDHRPASGHVFS
jgi:hypothetical protein